ncbi:MULTISPECIES: 50S ribosomal protein L18 [unclassified Campylobacter]|uniref:50S ribosomal protein L18 n=1 Tax=unclassified Campylobacter TaxID=2593542 RepID=UPI001BDB5B00|nr:MULTISPECIES: 50S ribosomal protein L18 [unclassified Campylobacter]MBZ7975697.1 50S ribosomal protein L18 [Campylobacter sp. RM12637]MBZ7978037.1 50S ribosomal protein L18 [Campylobacter sp. RM12654]MBZ7982221.1 50S ribosomal protein L18 [Campylobacter sp. RM12640]MBZ7984541.1 50S ribosomal protein L18 [Campylobacter sp. RM12647]MBZ7989402.1 50S ribosomal protein L18 [Campylobacter sp. RM12635]MBZ7991638.1 50S ribosomal protein L18 [Campylobacter sp. RM9331]MBZ7992288.1 50S ribosomal pro
MRANILKRKLSLRIKRKKRIRAKISGCATLPRVSIFKSNRTLYVQAIDDVKAHTIASVNGKKLGIKANIEGAKKLAAEFAKSLKAAKIEEAVFDRNGYLYHGVVAAFADALRENGIKL